jgi:hypothetical protein
LAAKVFISALHFLTPLCTCCSAVRFSAFHLLFRMAFFASAFRLLLRFAFVM